MGTIVVLNDARTFEAYLDLAGDDFTGRNHFVPGDLHGNKSLSEFFYLTEQVAFPDGNHTVNHLFGEEDRVAPGLSYSPSYHPLSA